MTNETRLKVALLVREHLSHDDGTTVRAKRVFACLSQHFDTTIIGLGKSDVPERSLAVRVPDLIPLLQIPLWLIGVVQLLMSHKFDILYICDDWFGSVVYLIMHRLFKQRLIFEAHGILSEESRVYGKSRFLTWLLHCWEIIVSSKCDLVIALSIDISRFYKRYARRVELIPVFVDTAAYNVKSRRAEQFKESIFRGKKLVGVIGPFDIKWNESSLDFLEKNINQFDPRITFAIIGRCKRKKMIARTFYTGYLTDFNTFLSHLDAVLVTSTLSTSGPLNKIIEPMACSLPVFTTPEGFVGMDYAKAGKDIVVAKQIDMVRTVNSLIFNESLMTTIGRAARSTVQRYYSLDVNRERLFEITSSLSA